MYPILQKTDFVLDDPVAFYPTNRVFNTDSDGGNATIHRLLRRCKFSARRFFRGLDDRDILQAEALEALILIQTAARRQPVARFFYQTLIRRFAFSGMT
jgi:hypothetical protein